ncbi:MAG TPA: hypothetical protein IAA32_00175 [Candidatus Butyricicoccus stercorigallinarum]|nr:hypothetical protein [Candidatus Butyricicoccus stercorigallinarum]
MLAIEKTKNGAKRKSVLRRCKSSASDALFFVDPIIRIPAAMHKGSVHSVAKNFGTIYTVMAACARTEAAGGAPLSIEQNKNFVQLGVGSFRKSAPDGRFSACQFCAVFRKSFDDFARFLAVPAASPVRAAGSVRFF